MSSKDIDEKLKNLEREINGSTPSESSAQLPTSLSTLHNQFLQWFQTLSKEGKIAVVVGGAIVGLALLKTLVGLISLSITLVFLGGLLYFGYKFFVAPNNSNNDSEEYDDDPRQP